MDIVETDYPQDQTAGLTKAKYILDRERPFTGYCNEKLKTPKDIAAHLEKYFTHYEKSLVNPNADFYIFLEARNHGAEAKRFRKYFQENVAEFALNVIILSLQGGSALILGKSTYHRPEEFLQADKNTQDDIIARLANPNSKLSIWVAAFPDLQQTINKWRSLGQFDAKTFRYALRQGFCYKSDVARDAIEFVQLFRKYFPEFVSTDTDSQQLRDRADYWLKNYAGASLCQVMIDDVREMDHSGNDICFMLQYISAHAESAGIPIYHIIEATFPRLKSLAAKDRKAAKCAFGEIKAGVERYWEYEYQTKSPRFLDVLKGYLLFFENPTQDYGSFPALLAARLSGKIKAGLRGDVNRIKNDEQLVISYRNEQESLIEKLKLMNGRNPVVKRFEEEQALIDIRLRMVGNRIAMEKQAKTVELQEKFKQGVAQRQAIDERLRKQNSQAGCASSCLSIIGASLLLPFTIFLIFLFFDSPSNAAYVIVSFITIGVMLTKIGKNKKKKAVVPIQHFTPQFTQNEQNALAQSMANIEKYFSDKEKFERFSEMVRIMLLNDEEFTKEYLSTC